MVMRKKIAIIELDYHPEVLYNTCKILINSTFDINIFTIEKIALEIKELLPEEGLHWNICTNKKTIRSFIKENLNLLNASDLIIFNTLASNFSFFSKLNLKPVTVLRIHNTYSYFAPGNHIKLVPSLYFVWKDTSHFIRKTIGELDWYYRKKFLKSVDYICFPDEEIRKFASTNGLIKGYKTIPSLPITYFDPGFYKPFSGNEIIITIPGTVDQRRRNYQDVLLALGMIKDKLNIPVVVNFLGKPKDAYGKEIIRNAASLANKNLKIVTFSQKIPFDLFNNILKNTDFFILPIVIDTKYLIYEEKYGYTKISGSINDMIHTGKPSIVTSDYPLNPQLKGICDSYGTPSDLAGKLLQWINNKKFQLYSQNLFSSLNYYNQESILKLYTETIYKTINKEYLPWE